MLPKNKRLNLKSEFSRVIKGRRMETANYLIYLAPATLEFSRVGISIRTKNFGKAHNRNRARRLTAQAIQNLSSNLPKKADLIIMPKSGVLENEVEILGKELENVLAGYKID